MLCTKIFTSWREYLYSTFTSASVFHTKRAEWIQYGTELERTKYL